MCQGCIMSKLQANIMVLVLKLHLVPNELPEKAYLAKQMIYPIELNVEKVHVCYNYCILYFGDNMKTWMCAHSVKFRDTSNASQIRIIRPEEGP